MTEEALAGREAEQAEFAAWLAGLAGASGRGGGRRAARGRPEAAAQAGGSRVLLVHGPGGSGKSRLLRRFETMARAQARTAPLDWSRVAAWDFDQGAGLAADFAIVSVLGALRWAVAHAFADEEELTPGRVTYEFRDYTRAADRMAEYVARAREVVDQAGRAGYPCSAADAASLMRKLESAGLALFMGPSESQDQAAGGSAPLSPVIAEAITKRAPDELPPQEYALVTDPAVELARRFAAAVSALASRRPLIFFLDSGDLIGEPAWRWLRLVMTRTSDRVAWVVAGPVDDVAGLEDQVIAISPASWDDPAIGAYLAGRPNARHCSGEEIALIGRFTAGLPLAVSLLASLLDGGASVAQVCAEADSEAPEPATTLLARQILDGAGAGQLDAARIVALALGCGPPGDTDLLAALWGDSRPQDIAGELASRHDFVFLPIPRLHPDVRDALRSELLDPGRRPLARPASQRARSQSLARLKAASSRWPTLDEQLVRTEFVVSLLRSLWYSAWISNDDGLDVLAASSPVLMVASPRFARVAWTIARRFADSCTPEQKHRLEQLATAPPAPSAQGQQHELIGQPGDLQAAGRILRARQLAEQDQHQEAVDNLAAAVTETASGLLRQAIGGHALAIAGELMRPGPDGHSRSDATSLAAAELAAELLPDNVVAWRCYGAALYHAGRAHEALAAYDKALEFYPDDAVIVSNLGAALRLLGRLGEALKAHDRALAAEPDEVHFRCSRATTLLLLGRLPEALADADAAIVLDPAHAPGHVSRGVVLTASGRHAEALAAFEQGIALDPVNSGAASAWAGAICWRQGGEEIARQHFARVPGGLTQQLPYQQAELEAIAECVLGEPDRAADRLRAAISLRSPGDWTRSRTLFDLLADPPLPGIDSLRAIAAARG